MFGSMSSSDPSTDSRGGVSGDPREGHSPVQPAGSGLYVVSTPIGNLRDITLRALDILSTVEEVLAEDTRVAAKLLNAHGISAKLSAYHDHNGAQRRPELLERLKGGASIALISDAGTPLVSDPGWKLAREAVEAGVKIVPVPGASAMLAGLVASGLPSDRFMFAGFLPPKSGGRKKVAKALANVPSTLIFYESGPRLAAALSDLSDILGGEREASVARELTKLFEETRCGTLDELAKHYAKEGAPKGEIVLLVGPPLEREASEADIDAALQDALGRLPVKAAANEIAETFGISKRDAYQRALALKDG